jgi:hypothetical protein
MNGDMLGIEDEAQRTVDDLEDSVTSRIFNAVFMPTNPFIIVSIPAVSVLLCQTAWIGGTYVPLQPPGNGLCDYRYGLSFLSHFFSEMFHFCPCNAGPDVLNGFAQYQQPNLFTIESTYTDVKRLLVIGDSLVLSIGCTGAENAHLLTQTMASTISKESALSIEWRSLGLNGAGVDVIHDAAMNYLRRPSQRDSSGVGDISDPALPQRRTIFINSMANYPYAVNEDKAQTLIEIATQEPCDGAGTKSLSPLPSSHADACVIFCGLNDFKRLWQGRTAGAFRRDLKRFLLELRAEIGPKCLIFLPALPLEPTQFPEPLRTLVIHLGAVFDAQKERIASELPGVVYLAKPERAWWRRVHLEVGEVIAEDGVHPNERGYTVYGQFLGSAVARHLVRPHA